jgi:hypothetical protein
MPIVSVVFGGLLIAVGLWAYLSTDGKSVTALIPAFVGAPLVVAGLVALKESLLKHAMHAAAVVGLLGLLGGLGNLARVAARGGDLTDTAGVATLLMTALSAAFVGLCVNSFVQARKRRAAREAQQG